MVFANGGEATREAIIASQLEKKAKRKAIIVRENTRKLGKQHTPTRVNPEEHLFTRAQCITFYIFIHINYKKS